MDALAERSGLWNGTVFRRFGSRAGIFAALLDDGSPATMTQTHIRMRLDVPLPLYLPLDDNGPPEEIGDRLSRGWEDLVQRVSR